MGHKVMGLFLFFISKCQPLPPPRVSPTILLLVCSIRRQSSLQRHQLLTRSSRIFCMKKPNQYLTQRNFNLTLGQSSTLELYEEPKLKICSFGFLSQIFHLQRARHVSSQNDYFHDEQLFLHVSTKEPKHKIMFNQ